MTSHLEAPHWMRLLHALFPPRGVILVGAGSGTGAWVETLSRWEGVPITLVEAEASQFQQLQRTVPARENVHLQACVIAPRTETVCFHQASKLDESGLLDPDILRSVWPNLTARDQRSQQALSLGDFMDANAQPANWLVVDCLPALPLLQGAEERLAGVDVIALRVLMDANLSSVSEAGLDAAHAWLEARGFRCCDTQVDRHPALGQAVFVRDSATALKDVRRQLFTALERAQQAEQRQVAVEAELSTRQAIWDADQRGWAQEREALAQAVAGKEAVIRDQVAQIKAFEARIVQLEAGHASQIAQMQGDLKRSEQSQAAASAQLADSKRQLDIAKKAPPPSRTAGDADIDGLIADLAPFFTERSLTYVDVGAYVGDVFLKLHQSKALRIREAHLYEPNPTSHGTLVQRLEACRIPTLHAYPLAVGAHAGPRRFKAAQSMTRVADDAPLDDENHSTFLAEGVTLDQQVKNFTDGCIGLLKIDVEGCERAVLEGADALLRAQAVDVIYIEVGFNRRGTQQTYFGDIDAFLQERGYRVFRIYEQMNEWIQDLPLLRRCNFAYMSERFASQNPLKLTLKLQALQAEVQRLQANAVPPGATKVADALP